MPQPNKKILLDNEPGPNQAGTYQWAVTYGRPDHFAEVDPSRPIETKTWTPPMRRCLLIALLLAGFGSAAAPAQAGNSWMFERSYYSHQPATPVTIGHRARGGPFYTRPQGAYFNGGFRRLRSTINIGGQIYDNLNLFESWAQTGGQF